MKVGLFFGSFNPIHIGHMVIAGYMLEFTDIEELWFVVSPHNPLKDIKDLADDEQRLKMVELATENHLPKMQVCSIEMDLPKPSYTIDTLKILKEKHPEKSFVIIMGSDSIDIIEKWKDYQNLLKDNTIYVYPRLGSDTNALEQKYPVKIVNAPVIEISSTFIRRCIGESRDVSYLLPEKVDRYIKKHGIYKNTKI